jgi:hypothetical protein
MFIAGFLLGLLFDLEDGGDTFLRNVYGFQSNYAALQPISSNSSVTAVRTSNPTCSFYLLPPTSNRKLLYHAHFTLSMLKKKLNCTLEDTTAESAEHMKLHTYLDLLFKRMDCQLVIYVCCMYKTNTLKETTSSSHTSTYGSATALNSQRVNSEPFLSPNAPNGQAA